MAMPGGRDMSRAERFEDEKRRIIDSCFSKKDEDGSILETYITHIKITEYSASPTSPPPPNLRTNPSAEKPRVIIVAVRKSGRVRMHKSKENANGTFSIGKTWNLDDLSAIESFTSATANPDHQAWAGDVGFVITLGKPYYWQAQTDKEKKFFIASLIKIYGKYTNGRSPALSGFDQRELDQVLGGAQTPRGPPRPPPGRIPPVPSGPGMNSATSSNASALVPQMEQYPSQQARAGRSPMVPNGSASPARSFESGPRQQDQSSLRRLAASNNSQDSVAHSFATRSEDTGSLRQRPGSRNGVNGANSSLNAGNSSYGTPPPEPRPEEKPPERRRPPMDPLRPMQQMDKDLVPAPLMSPGMRSRSGEPTPPPRSMDRMSPRKPSTRRTDSDRPGFSERTAMGDREKTLAIKDPTGIDAPGAFPASPLDTPTVAMSPIPGAAPTTALPPSPTQAAAPEPAPEPSPVQTPLSPPPDPEEDSRPGLGPMIKAKKSKGEIAGAFWKAAAAANASLANASFKPRPGGAAERLRQAALAAAAKSADEPDGITAVVPAPPRPASVQKAPESTGPTEPPPRNADRNSSNIPEVKITVPASSRPSSLQPDIKEEKKAEDAEPEEVTPRRPVVTGNDVKYLVTLGVDPSILDGRSTELAKWLDCFGWVPGEKMRAKTYEDVKADVERELNEAQAGGWLARFREDDERVGAIKRGIDVAINECDELDNLLTLYSVELSTLSDDIAYIEAQGQGLQVQASNQKLLKSELESLLKTCAISANDLDPLRTSPLESVGGVEEIEGSLVALYRAMQRIDPDMNNESRKSEDGSTGLAAGFDADFSQMHIVKEKKVMYASESQLFMRRLVEFMARQFDLANGATKRAMDGALSKKLDPENHQAGRELLWQYSPLVLYARDMDRKNWDRIIQVYQGTSHPVYKSEIRNALEKWRANARKPTGDESELLFTSLQEKKEEGIATTARKLTVKRSQTLARTLRGPLGDGGSRTNLEKSSHGRALAYEVFNGAIDDLLPLVEMEQNFIVDFFHATSLEQTDFPDVVAAARPRDRRGGDLKRHRLMEPDRDLARRVTKAMEVIFDFLEKELSNLVDWVLSQDPLQGAGVLATLERKMADLGQSNQDFLSSLLQKLHSSLETRFKRFVDEQIRAIEETKVKIKKRKGVIGFMRIFPTFLTAVENLLAGVDPNLNVRRTVDREYDRILKSMFDSLKVIARETPSVTAAAGGGSSVMTGTSAGSADPEDKEALNFHILLIENMNHYLEEVEPRGIEVLEDWATAAQTELTGHLTLYLSSVMRRPLGKLLDQLENIESQLASGKTPTSIASQPSNSRAVFNKILSNYDGKEVRKGIETLRKRVEKHFGDEDNVAAAQKLTGVVLGKCEAFYGDVERRIARVTAEVYGGDVLFEWPRGEVRGAFGGR